LDEPFDDRTKQKESGCRLIHDPIRNMSRRDICRSIAFDHFLESSEAWQIVAPGEGRAPAVQVPSFARIPLDNVFLIRPDGPSGTVEPVMGSTVRLIAMRGRRISDETAEVVRELRRRGVSLRGIARRTKISKTSVYRLTKDIPWEHHSVQPTCIATGERTEQAAHLFTATRPQVPPAKMDSQEKSGLNQLRAYLTQNPILCPVRRDQAQNQRYVCLRVLDSEEAELDEAEAYVKRMPFASELYEHVDFLSLLEAMRSKDPLREYRELRKKTLAPAAMMLRLNRILCPPRLP
jgi:hypothetical protein